MKVIIAIFLCVVVAVQASTNLPYAGLTANDINTNVDDLITKYMKADWQPSSLTLQQQQQSTTTPLTTEEVSSFLELAVRGPDPTTTTGGESTTVGACEVCVFVLENKEQHQPYLCRGLKDPAYQTACVQVLEALMWWVTNQVYWVNYGCQQTGAETQWVRPCPAHAICSWIENLYTRQPFCPLDPQFKKPQ